MRLTKASWLFAVLAAALSFGLVACGGDDKEEYSDDLGSALAPIVDNTELQEALANPESLSGFADSISQQQEQLNTAADELDGIEPPGDVADAHQKLIDALRNFSEAIEPVRQAAEDGDEEAIAAELPNIEAATAEFQEQLGEAVETFEEQGVPAPEQFQ